MTVCFPPAARNRRNVRLNQGSSAFVRRALTAGQLKNSTKTTITSNKRLKNVSNIKGGLKAVEEGW